MTVQELIDKLKTCDKDALVVTRGYEAGYDSVTSVYLCTVALNVNTAWYYGAHEILEESLDEYKVYETAKAVRIG